MYAPLFVKYLFIYTYHWYKNIVIRPWFCLHVIKFWLDPTVHCGGRE